MPKNSKKGKGSRPSSKKSSKKRIPRPKTPVSEPPGSTDVKVKDGDVTTSGQSQDQGIAPPILNEAETLGEDTEVLPPSDSKDLKAPDLDMTRKGQFRRYLIKSGFKYAIIRAFVALYEDKEPKPDEPLPWILGAVGAGIPSVAELDKYRAEVKEIRDKIAKLQEENFDLRSKLDVHEAADPPDSLADQELKKMIQELTEAGALGPTLLTSTSTSAPEEEEGEEEEKEEDEEEEEEVLPSEIMA